MLSIFGSIGIRNKLYFDYWAEQDNVVQKIVLTYESIAFERGQALLSTIEEGIEFNGNENGIRQLLAILLYNAIKKQLEA